MAPAPTFAHLPPPTLPHEAPFTSCAQQELPFPLTCLKATGIINKHAPSLLFHAVFLGCGTTDAAAGAVGGKGAIELLQRQSERTMRKEADCDDMESVSW